MKKTLSILLILTLTLLAGCSSSGAIGSETSRTPFPIRYELGSLADDFLDLPESAFPGETVEIRTQKLIDADLHVYADGQEIEKTHEDDDFWGYTFVMPEKEVLITSKPYTESEILGSEKDAQILPFKAQYIRTDGYHDGERYPKIFWITSVEELDRYYRDNKNKYNLESRENPYSDETIGFLDAIGHYDGAFFEKNDLIFVLLEEGSGSVRHEVASIRRTPSQDDDRPYLLQPEIRRIIPEVGTDDMAQWHIILEIGKEYGQAVSDLKDPVITDAYNSAPQEMFSDTAAANGPYGQISVLLPDSWSAQESPVDSDMLEFGLYGLILRPDSAASGQIELTCTDTFGVCGTGLETHQAVLSGTEVQIGTFDDHAHWDYILFPHGRTQIVAQHTDCSAWTQELWDEAYAILDTVVFDEALTEGGVGQYIPESENESAGVFLDVRNVTPTGLTAVIRRYERIEGLELTCEERYTLERLEGASRWTDVPQLIENPIYSDAVYFISEEEETVIETDWQWLYGKLGPGTYRIRWCVYAYRDGQGNEEIPLKAQFLLAGSP